MPPRRISEADIATFFQTAPLDVASAMLRVAAGVLAARGGDTKIPTPRRRKHLQKVERTGTDPA